MTSNSRIPIEQRRGSYCADMDDGYVLVLSPVESVSQALHQIWQVKQWEKDTYGRDVDIQEQGYVVFQFRGHVWTCIHEYGYAIGMGVSEQEAQTLSALLHTRVVGYTISDTCGMEGYNYYDDGKLVEKLYYEWGSPLQFESELRSFISTHPVEVADDVEDYEYARDVSWFIHDFWQQQGIYIPLLFMEEFHPGQGITLCNAPLDGSDREIFERDDFERVDYIVRA